MKILYGVASEGIGHAVCSSVVREHLVGLGHSVTFACAKGTRACGMLAKYGPVVSVTGLKITHDSTGRVNPLRTVGSNLKNLALMSIEPMRLATMPRPDVVFTDFEPVTARYANMLGLPLIAINSLHGLDRLEHPKTIAGPYRKLAAVSIPFISAVVPDAHRYMVPTFVQLPVRRSRTTTHAPILEDIPPSNSDGSVVVYFNERAPWPSIIEALKACAPMKFKCYGSGQEGVDCNVTLCPPSDQFVTDFANAGAVIGATGFTFVARAIYSRKPMLARPVEGHLENQINAAYLEKLGFGMRCDELTPQIVSDFLQRCPEFEKNLEPVRHDGNRGLLQSIDRMLGA